MNNDKCEFCKGTGKEPGEPGCVWCLNTGRKIYQTRMTPPAQQQQVKPAAWVRFRNGEPDYDGDAVMIMNVPGDTLGDGDSWEPVYTHADSVDVSRLRDSIKALTELSLARLDVICAMRAQLAERDALLRDKSGDLIRMAAHLISAPLFALQDLQDEDKKMTRARVDAAVDSADARLKDAAYELRRIADALSASAEPSAPKCKYCSYSAPTETLYERGRRIFAEGKGMSCIWGDCKSDDEMPEVERGWKSAFDEAVAARDALEPKP